jgi:hypothetical protein
MRKGRSRKGAVSNINRVLCSNSISESLLAGRGVPSSLHLFSLLAAQRWIHKKYGINSVRYTLLSCMEAIEYKCGFFWRSLSYEVEPASRCFDWLLKRGYFTPVPYPLTYSHIIHGRTKVYILSPFGREVLEAFHKEYKKQITRSKRGKVIKADKLA